FDEVAISPDCHAVGWIGLYLFRGGGEPMPLKVFVYSNGRTLAFDGWWKVPIFRWRFLAGVSHVAFEQEAYHFDVPHYELHDVANGALLGRYDSPVNPDNSPAPEPPLTELPSWVQIMKSALLSPAVPLRLKVQCDRASQLTFTLTVQNVSGMPHAAVIGDVIGNDKRYDLAGVTVTVRRSGAPDTLLQFRDL